MIELFNILEAFLGNFSFLFFVTSTAFVIKSYILLFLLLPGIAKTTIKKPLIFLILVCIGSLVGDFVWASWFFRRLFALGFDSLMISLIRFAWIAMIIQYHSLNLFIESLTEPKYRYAVHQKLLLIFSGIIISFYIYLIFTSNHQIYEEHYFYRFSFFYAVGLILIAILIFTLNKPTIHRLPKILKKQLKVAINYLITPFVISEIIQFTPFSIVSQTTTGHFAILALSTILIICTMIFSAKKIIGLRFVNLYKHVQPSYTLNFIRDFKKALCEVGEASTIENLHQITQEFFKQAFRIPTNYTTLYLQHTESRMAHTSLPAMPYCQESIAEYTVSAYIKNYKNFTTMLKEKRILIYDEIALSAFYDDKLYESFLIPFLDELNADVFLPIFDHHSLMGYIIIVRNARENKFYNSIEKDEMLVFTTYLNTIINSLYYKVFSDLAQKENVIRKELAIKQEELNYYKEIMRSLLHDDQHRKIGVIFYKNHKFIYANKESREIIHINLNTETEHPLTQTFKKLVYYAHEHKKGYTLSTHDQKGEQLTLSCTPTLENNTFIISISYPEIPQTIKKQLSIAKAPSEWDYILSLETNKIGKLVSHLLPNTSEKIMALKIELLKMMLNKKALFIHCPPDELFTLVEIFHALDMRETLHFLTLQQPTTTHDIEIKLFGINPLFETQQQQPLLQQLDESGTLFIQNIDLLDLDTQNKLAEFIKEGSFQGYKNNQKIESNVQIMCSSSKNLAQLAQDQKFSPLLIYQLQQATLSIASLLHLSGQEFNNFAQEHAALENDHALQALIQYTYNEKQSVAERLLPLQNFKHYVHHYIQQKQFCALQKYTISHASGNDTALLLGKKALKDHFVMTQLWNKFKDQGKIAVALGVHRSSVYRYYKKHNLTNNTHDA